MSKLRHAAATLIANLMERHGLKSVDELTCPDMRALAAALEPRPRKHGPAAPKRGIGVHSSQDMFRGK